MIVSATLTGLNTMPLGLISSTRPFDSSAPMMSEGAVPVMRLSTALCGLCCTNRRSSPVAIEKLGQSMMAPGVLVMV
jgi:hypothetical protein